MFSPLSLFPSPRLPLSVSSASSLFPSGLPRAFSRLGGIAGNGREEIDDGRLEEGGDAGISVPSAVKWLNALEASFLVFRLRPWHGNISSRQVKSPKIYFPEPGLAAWLVGIRDASQIARVWKLAQPPASPLAVCAPRRARAFSRML